MELQKIKAVASAVLGTLFGAGSFASLWLAAYSVWPSIIGFIAITLIQLFISLWYLGIASQSGRVYADIKHVEGKNSKVSGTRE